MSQTEAGDHASAAPPRRRRAHWNAGVPARTLLIQAGILVALALVSAWLLQRLDSIGRERHLALQARAQAEVIAQAAKLEITSRLAGSQRPFDDSSRLIRILECSVRGGNILAGAVLDSSGTVIAHTDLSKIGTKWDLRGPRAGSGGMGSRGLAPELFGGGSGDFLVQPLLGPHGVDGAVALLLPEITLEAEARPLLLYFLPAAMVLLAFLVVNQSAVRSALRPASEGFSQLARAAGWEGDPAETIGTPGDQYGVVGDIASRIESLAETNDELLLTNRLLRFENNRMKMTLDHFPDGLIVTNKMNNVIFVNRRAMRIMGLTTEGEDDRDPNDPPVELLRTMREVDRSGQVLIPSAANGPERQVLCSKVPVTTAAGKTLGALYSMRDVTAQQSAVKAQAEFLSQITHELKAPLNTVVAYAETLAEGGEMGLEERREFYNTITSEADRMGRLISNLLQLSRIQLGNLSASFNLMKPGSLVEDQIESLRIQAEDGGLTLDVRIPQNLPAVRGDKDLLAVAINNLLSNALKYTPEGGTVTIRAKEENEGVTIEVKDTGIGIPEEVRPRVFDRFFRSDQESIQRKPGSGLGLYLVKEIVEIHNGRATVESHVGSGSRFVIWLPALEVGSSLEPAEAAA